MTTFLQNFERCQQEGADQRRKEWFAKENEHVPDLDFFPPDCPICWLMTEWDDGYFTCGRCDVSWPQTGYGHEACRADGSDLTLTERNPL